MTEQELVETTESALVEAEPASGAEAAAEALAASSSAEASNAETPEDDAALFAAGTWKGHPRFECPKCPHAVVADHGGTALILQHIGQRHSRVRVSSVLGPDGKPVVKLETR